MPVYAQWIQLPDDFGQTHCRPFDRSRTGLNLGEGAGYLVLQSESSLQRTPYCELSGYANTNEAYHQTGSSPEGDGAFLSMSEAIASSGISLEKIDYINVHGTGTPGMMRQKAWRSEESLENTFRHLVR